MKTLCARRLVLSIAVLLSAMSARAANWTNQGYSAGINGFNPHETTISTGNVASLALTWQSSTSDINGVFGLIEDNGMIFVQSNDSSNAADVVALDPSNGAELWKASLNASGATFGTISGIATGNGQVFSPCLHDSEEGYCAFNQKTGKLGWFDSLYIQGIADGGPLYRPTYAQGVVYVASGTCDPNVANCNDYFALNAKTGAVMWASSPSASGFDFNGWPESPAVSLATGLDYQPCVYVYNGNTEDTFQGLCTFSTSTGASGWQFGQPNNPDAVLGAVSVSGNTVYFQYDDGTSCQPCDRTLFALNAQTGAQLWSFVSPSNGFHDLTQPTAIKRTVYFLDDAGELWALSAKNGKTLWSVGNWGSFCSPTNGTESQAEVANGVIYITAGCQNGGTRYVTTFALDAGNGNTLWSDGEGFNTTPIVSSGAAPVIVNGTLYADCVNVCAYNPLAGRQSRTGRNAAVAPRTR